MIFNHIHCWRKDFIIKYKHILFGHNIYMSVLLFLLLLYICRISKLNLIKIFLNLTSLFQAKREREDLAILLNYLYPLPRIFSKVIKISLCPLKLWRQSIRLQVNLKIKIWQLTLSLFSLRRILLRIFKLSNVHIRKDIKRGKIMARRREDGRRKNIKNLFKVSQDIAYLNISFLAIKLYGKDWKKVEYFI